MECAAQYLCKEPSRADILSVFAGLRPLVKGSTDKTSALSRDHTIVVSESGLVTITGGKWTTYRRMAEVTVDRLAATAGLSKRACVTRDLRLEGSDTRTSPWAEFGVSEADAHRYEELYPGDLHPAPAYPFRSGTVDLYAEVSGARSLLPAEPPLERVSADGAARPG